MKKIIAHYEQTSNEYPEDNWEINMEVRNAEDVFEFMKECHIRDASNRNDYPLVSHWGRYVDFYKQEYQVCNLGHEHLGERTKITPPLYYEKGKEFYNSWVSRINRTIPHLRKAHKRKQKELKEKNEFERLKKKFS